MNISESQFAYNATIKLGELPTCKAQTAFPGVADLAINSRNFATYMECVSAAKSMMEDFVNEVNTTNKGYQFTVSAEVNPIHSGEPTRSRDWSSEEVARLWIFDKKQEGSASIHAVGQARIFAMGQADPVKLN